MAELLKKMSEINAVSGNVDEGLIFCGAYAYKINDISTVKDIIKNYF